jgi:hypothetical protein
MFDKLRRILFENLVALKLSEIIEGKCVKNVTAIRLDKLQYCFSKNRGPIYPHIHLA